MKRTTEPIKKPKRKQIGVQIDELIWRKFRSKCIEDNIAAGLKIEELISKYLMEGSAIEKNDKN